MMYQYTSLCSGGVFLLVQQGAPESLTYFRFGPQDSIAPVGETRIALREIRREAGA